MDLARNGLNVETVKSLGFSENKFCFSSVVTFLAQ